MPLSENRGMSTLETAKIEAEGALSRMGISDAVCLLGALDGMESLRAMSDFLHSRPSGPVCVAGDAAANALDAYDVALNFAEDNYCRIRAKKSDDGWYVVVAAERL